MTVVEELAPGSSMVLSIHPLARRGWILALLLVACHDQGVEPFTASVSPSRVWAGGTVTVHSSRVKPGGSTVLLADTVPLTIVQAGGDSVVALVPGSARGSYTLRFDNLAGPVIGKIEVAGFRRFTSLPRFIGFYLLAWPEGGVASILGGENDDVLQLDPGNGTVRTLLSGYTVGQVYARLPGRTPDPAVLLLQPANLESPAETWRLLPTPTRLGSVPFSNGRHLALLSDSVVLLASHHEIYTYRLTGSRIYVGSYEETNEVVISPSRDRVAFRVNYTSAPVGPPVFDAASGLPVYHVTQLAGSYGVAFSEQGDTLWMLGSTRDGKPLLIMLDARTGREMARRTFVGHALQGLRKDPRASTLFVTASDAQGPPELLVVDGRSLQTIGDITPPPDLQCECFDLSVIAAGTDGVFVVSALGEEGVAIYAFDTLPPGQHP